MPMALSMVSFVTLIKQKLQQLLTKKQINMPSSLQQAR